MKRLFTFLFAFISACTFTVYAAIVEGTCGDNLIWTLNTKDSTLVISGEGKMTNNNHSPGFVYNTMPWYEYESYFNHVIIQDGVTNIAIAAFYDCSNITSVTIPSSVTSIENEAFWNCSGLIKTNYTGDIAGWCNIKNRSNPTAYSKNLFINNQEIKDLVIPNSVASIGDEAFVGCCGLTSATIPNSVTSIGNRVFADCSGLTSVTIGNSVTSIGIEAFYGCSSLMSITIPNSVTSIENDAFRGCKSLTTIEIPNSVTSIGSGVFYGCSGLTSVTIPNSVTSIEWGTFYGCSSLMSITIPNSVTSIKINAFNSCSDLTSVTIGNSVKTIGEYAFDYCNNIQEVTSYAPVPPSAASCALNHTSCTLYVLAEYLDTYSNTIWWEDFGEIRAIDADYVVTFLDWDGTVLASAAAAAGQAVTAPDAPTREGYTFIGWDADFSCVIGDMIVTAQYQINRYQVRFFDWNETLLLTDSVEYLSAATAPDDPYREGYTFIDWDKDFSTITTDLDVHAQYEAGADKDFAVIFSDHNNNELSTQSVTIRVPLAPEIEGFIFLYWQTVTARIDEGITIQAVYESNMPSASPEVFVNPANPAQKLIRNGSVYILQEDKMYTISGQVVK